MHNIIRDSCGFSESVPSTDERYIDLALNAYVVYILTILSCSMATENLAGHKFITSLHLVHDYEHTHFKHGFLHNTGCLNVISIQFSLDSVLLMAHTMHNSGQVWSYMYFQHSSCQLQYIICGMATMELQVIYKYIYISMLPILFTQTCRRIKTLEATFCSTISPLIVHICLGS